MAIRIVTGAPCSGKSTYVQEHASPGEVIIDYDLIARAIGAPDHRPQEPYRSTAFVMRRAGIDEVLEKGTPAWIIHTDPSPSQIAKYALAGAEFIRIEATEEECLERAADRPEGTAEAIREYFAAREQKGAPAMQTKSIELEIKSAEGEAPGIIAYASTFDRVPDAYGDVVAKGAFAGSLKRLEESGMNLPLLYGHVMDDPAAIIGTVTKAVEDDHGLLVEATFDMDNPAAAQVRRAVLAKAITKLSFAFSVLDQHTITLDDFGEVNELTELEIYEVSIVVVPANPRAQVVEARCAPVESAGGEAAVEMEPEEPAVEVKAEEPVEVKAEEPAGEPEVSEEIKPTEMKGLEMDIETMESIATAKPEAKSLAELAVEAVVGKGLKNSGKFSIVTPEIKAAAYIGKPTIYSQSRNVAEATGRLGVADLFGYEAIDGNSYTFIRQTDKDGSVAMVAEGAAKPFIDFTETLVTVPLSKVAAYIKESDECLEDAAWLASAIDGRLNWRLSRLFETQLLTGNGTAPNLTGILTTSGIGGVTYAHGGQLTEAAMLSAIEKVMTDSGLPADAIIVNPTDYVKVVSAALSASHSLFNDSYDQFLGLPIVKSDLITAGTALVGAFKQAATIIAKGGRRVEIANQNEDDFTKNLVCIRAEERAALAVRIPSAFVKITEAAS